MTEDQGLMTFDDGQLLFSSGDPGGELLIIEKGKVEIFRKDNSTHVSLSYMQKGEIIGLITCLNQKPRTASARAVGKVVVRKIPTEKIKKTLSTVPNWIGIVIKEFSIRINNLLDMVVEQKGQLESAQSTQVDLSYQAHLICSLMSNLARHHTIETENGPYVVIKDLTDMISESLFIDEDRVEHIVEILKQSGLIKLEKDPDRDRYIVQESIIIAIIDLAYFIRDSRSGLNKKLINHPFKDRTIRLARAMIMFAAKEGLATGREIKLDCRGLEDNLERKMGEKFQIEALDDLHQLKLMNVDAECISFVPNKLGRTIAHIVAYQKLKNYKPD